MKLKLAALLMFSQSAESMPNVNAKNYRESFCDESLFKPTSTQYASNDISSVEREQVKGFHDRYCTVREWYEKAVRDDTNSLDKSKHSCAIAPELGNFITRASCTTITGMEYGTVCNQARDFKSDAGNQGKWDVVMRTVKPCSTVGRK